MEYAEVKFLQKLGLTEAMVRDHVIRPNHLQDAALHIELHEVGDVDDDAGDAPPPSGLFYRLNVQKLGRELHELLSPCVAGYSMQLRRYGGTVWDRQWGWSKLPQENPGDPGIRWASHIPMHVASVSKLITAMAMTKLLYSRNISPDAHIAPWLPAYWHKGPGVDQITFRQLLNHTSGLVLKDEPGPSDFQFMKDQIALGTVGNPGYRNMNFGLCRILISTIDAPYLFDLLTPAITDRYWDLTTIRYYTNYVSANIFAPAGVMSTLVHTGHTLAYEHKPEVPGWNSGDLATMSGCVAWHLSVADLLNVMSAFRRRGTIVDTARAQTMLDRKFGLDEKKDTPLGRIYAKGGFWSSDSTGRFVEQSNVFLLPKGMELVVLANSPFCKPNGNLQSRILAVIENNIESNLFVLTAAALSAFAGLGLFRKTRARRKKR